MFLHGEITPCFFEGGIGAADVGAGGDDLKLNDGGFEVGKICRDGDGLAGTWFGGRVGDPWLECGGSFRAHDRKEQKSGHTSRLELPRASNRRIFHLG